MTNQPGVPIWQVIVLVIWEFWSQEGLCHRLTEVPHQEVGILFLVKAHKVNEQVAGKE